MATQEQKISVKDLAEEVTIILKDEMVAQFVEEDDALQLHFQNGQKFRLKVEEMQ